MYIQYSPNNYSVVLVQVTTDHKKQKNKKTKTKTKTKTNKAIISCFV